MKRSKLFYRIFFLIAMVVSSMFGGRCFWWTVSSGGGIDDTLRADTLRFKRGFTIGQTAIGPATHGTDLNANYGFWNDMFDDFELSFIVCDTAFDTFYNTWIIFPDSLDSLEHGEQVTMNSGDRFLVINTGECHITYGLQGISVSPYDWGFGVTPRYDILSVHGRFDRNEEPPISFAIIKDFIKDSPWWADDEYYGPEGYDVGINGLNNLWLRLIAPMGADNWPPCCVTITIRIWGRSYLP